MSEGDRAFGSGETDLGQAPVKGVRRISAVDWCFIGVAAVFVFSGLAAITDVNLYTPDSTRYLVWAKSLSSFSGYRDFTGPETHRYVLNAPLYALLLAPAAIFFPMNVIAAKAFTLAWGAVVLILCYRWTTRLGGKPAALAACILLAVNPLFLTYSTEVLSDVPFAAVLFGIFLLVPAIGEGRSSTSKLVTLIALLSAAVLLRELGMSVVIAVAVYLALSGRKKDSLTVALIPILVYLLWLVRNEVIVGGIESPALTNSKLFTHHFFTDPESSLAAEYFGRAGINIRQYAARAGGLLLFPMYGIGGSGLLAPDDPFISQVMSILSAGKYLLAAAAVAGGISGASAHCRKQRDSYLILIFTLLYLGIILLYPINDVRFLFPLLIVWAAYTGIGWLELIHRFAGKESPRRRIVMAGGALIVAALVIPNAVWISRSIESALRYRAREHDGFNDEGAAATLPRRYRMPLRLAGEWLDSNSPAGSVILTRFMDVASFMKDRKVVSFGDRASVDGIEGSIRDYGVPYVVTVDDGTGLWTFELQMRESGRYNFSLVRHIGDIGIFRVDPPTGSRGAVTGCEDTPLRRGLILLAGGRYAPISTPFDSNPQALSRSGEMTPSYLFMRALSEEYSMNMQSADALFAQFGGFAQAEEYIDEAAVHHQLIGILKSALIDPDPASRSRAYFSAAVGYWQLGQRIHARRLMDRAIAADSSNTPAYVLGFDFALEQRDTLGASLYVRESVRHEPEYGLNGSLTRILSLFDSVRTMPDRAIRSELHLRLAQAFDELKMSDDALDNLLLSTSESAENSAAWMQLANSFYYSGRYSLAARSIRRALSLNPGDGAAREALSRIEPFL